MVDSTVTFSALTWAARQLAFEDEASLLACAAQLPMQERSTAPLFLPYLSGERTPHNQALATACWFGLTAAHGREAMAYAVAEGVAFGLRDGLQTLATPEADLFTLSLVGGGARDVWWAQLLAHVLGLSLSLHEGAETGAALGAARLAWLACGGELEQVCSTPPVSRSFVPDAQQHAALSLRHNRFQALYRALLPEFLRPA